MTERSEPKRANRARLEAIVRPAFWIVAAAGQWGPEYAAWDDGRVWDVLIRFVLSMAFACMAVRAMKSNTKAEG